LGNNGCNASLAFAIEPPDLLEITLEPNATVNLGYSYLLDAQLNIPNSEIASVAWTPSTSLVCASCLSTLASPDFTTDYQIQVVSKEGCEARGTLHLRVDKTRRIYAPNIFSPDGDGSNDVFTIYADPVPVVRIKSLQVFSRWGEEIYVQKDFAPGDESLGWDGNFKGQKLNPSVFVWQAVVLFVDGKEELFTGDVTLQR
jgi:gliding motility-associated-like protein